MKSEEIYILNPDAQKKITIGDLASLIFKILKKNLQENRSVLYCSIQLSSIKEFEFLRDPRPRNGAVTGGGWPIKKEPQFDKKFAEAVHILFQKNLIMKDPSQHSDDFVVLTSKGEITAYDKVIFTFSSTNKIIQHIKKDIPNLDQVVEVYYAESIKAFQNELLISSAFTLGASSERAIYLLAEAVKNYLNNKADTKAFQDSEWSIKKLNEYTVDRLRRIKSNFRDKQDLFFEIDVKFNTLFTYYRLTRNEVGHPDRVPSLDKHELELNLKTFPKYLKKIFKIINLLEGSS